MVIGIFVAFFCLAWNIVRLINQISSNTDFTLYDYITYIIIALVVALYIVIAIGAIFNSYYEVGDKEVVLKWRFISIPAVRFSPIPAIKSMPFGRGCTPLPNCLCRTSVHPGNASLLRFRAVCPFPIILRHTPADDLKRSGMTIKRHFSFFEKLTFSKNL